MNRSIPTTWRAMCVILSHVLCLRLCPSRGFSRPWSVLNDVFDRRFRSKLQGRTQGVMGCQNTLSAASNTLSPHQLRSNFVKHPLQNTERDCHQWLSDSAPNSLSTGVPPQTPLWEFTTLPRPSSCFKGPYF